MRIRMIQFVVALMLCVSQSHAQQWEFFYSGDSLPYLPQLGDARWDLYNRIAPSDLSRTTVSEGILQVVDLWTDRTVRFYREGTSLAPGSSATVEVRVKVISAVTPSPGYLGFGISIGLQEAKVGLWPDKVGIKAKGDDFFRTVPADMTEFRTVRLAVLGSDLPVYQLWLEDRMLFEGQLGSSDRAGGIYFGMSPGGEPTGIAWWDYIAYSKQFLPVPEPASLLVLAAGLAGMGGVMRRRR